MYKQCYNKANDVITLLIVPHQYIETKYKYIGTVGIIFTVLNDTELRHIQLWHLLA